MEANLLEDLRAMEDRRAAALRAVEVHAGWYHTLDLVDGVSTPGLADLRPLLPHVLPADLRGRRCLDVGTFDGLYAFAMEDGGADEVVAIDVADPADLDHPPLRRAANMETVRNSGIQPGDGFNIAAAVRRSSARWVPCNVYDLTPEAIGGQVDFAVVSTILQHLRDPVGALERVREVLAPNGAAVIVETFLPRLSRWHRNEPLLQFRAAAQGSNYTWMVPNIAGLRAWAVAAGLNPEPGKPYRYSLRGQKLAGRDVAIAAIKVTGGR